MMVNANTTVTPELARALQPFALPISETKTWRRRVSGGGLKRNSWDMADDAEDAAGDEDADDAKPDDGKKEEDGQFE